MSSLHAMWHYMPIPLSKLFDATFGHDHEMDRHRYSAASRMMGYRISNESEYRKALTGCPIEVVHNPQIPSWAAEAFLRPKINHIDLKFLPLMDKAKRASERLGVAHFIAPTKQTPARIYYSGNVSKPRFSDNVVNGITFKPADKGKDKTGFYELFDVSTHVNGNKISEYKYKKAILDLLYPLPVELLKRRLTGYYEASIPATGYRYIFRPCLK